MDQVYVGGSYFHIYVSILRQLCRPDKTSKSILILNNFTPGLEVIIPHLKKAGYFDHIIQVPFISLKQKINAVRRKNLFTRIAYTNQVALDFVDTHSGIAEFDSFIRNAEINLFHKASLASSYFVMKYGQTNLIRMIEDGGNNYRAPISRWKAFMKKYVRNIPMGEGLDAEIKEIHVQHVDRLHPRIRHKGKTLELNAMRDSLSAQQRSEIVHTFMHGKDVNILSGNNLLLITQPWSEEHVMSETGKVEVYNRMLKKYTGSHSIFLKAHPRDLTNYHGKLEQAFTEIPRAFPLEMLDFMENIRFKTGLTVSSSALHNMHCVAEKIFFGNDYLKQA